MSDQTNPWVVDSIDGIKAAELILQSSLGSKLRISLILVDNAAELLLKAYLKASRTGGRNVDRMEFPALVGEFRGNTALGIDDQTWTRILTLHETRNSLYHGAAGLRPSTELVEEYVQLCHVLAEKLFQVTFQHLLESAASQTRNEYKWKVEFPKAFPNPLSENVMGTLFYFDLTLTVSGPENKLLSVYIASKSQSVIFFFPEREVGHKKYLVFGNRNVKTSALDAQVSQMLTRNEVTFAFTGAYRPNWAAKDYSTVGKVILEYYLMPNDAGKMGPYQLVIPFEPREKNELREH